MRRAAASYGRRSARLPDAGTRSFRLAVAPNQESKFELTENSNRRASRSALRARRLVPRARKSKSGSLV